MSQFCKTQLCATVESSASEIASSDATTDFLFSTFAMDNLATNRTQKINFGSLPDANTVPNGQVAYLDDVKVPVIASNGTWIGFDGRTVGTFVENQLFFWGENGVGIFTIPNGTGAVSCSPVREISFSTDWCQVSIGSYRGATIKSSGELWVWGRSDVSGPIGDGTTTTRCSQVREFCSATDWCQVSSGCEHGAAVKTSGELWVWGVGSFCRLGDGTGTTRCSPVREFCSATDWCQVSTGSQHTAAVKTSGQLWAWGRNQCGQLGTGSVSYSSSPVRERCSATNWCQVRTGCQHTAAIKTTGELWAWGNNTCGPIGDGTTTTRCSPVREFCSGTNWCQVSACALSNMTVAIKTTGELWAWGCNNCGQLGDGTVTTRTSPVREFCSGTNWGEVSTFTTHSAAIKTTGQLWSWGANRSGSLGNGTGNGAHSCSPVREFSSSSDWCQLSTGIKHSGAIKSVTIVCR